MIDFALSAGQLRAEAAQLAATIRSLEDSLVDASADVSRTPALGFTGLAADSAAHALHQDLAAWRPTTNSLRTAVTVLEAAAVAQQQLDSARERILATMTVLANPVLANDAFAIAALGALKASGDLLDAMTAMALQSLLAQHSATVEPPPGWEDDQAGHLQASHDLYYDAAPPEVRDLVDAHDLTLLELPDVGFVAAAADPATTAAATDLVTFVPGVSALDTAQWGEHVTRARQMGSAVGGTGGVGIVWLGYAAPPTTVQGADSFPARHGAIDLATFQSRLGQHFPAADKIVVGYSYGTVVVGHAAHPRQGGLVADDVVLVASPGTGVRRASELELIGEDPQVHAVTVPGDPITLTTGPYSGIHGVEPTSPGYGANVWNIPALGDHFWYFDPASSQEFLKALAREVGNRR